jgi:hypothetical protein
MTRPDDLPPTPIPLSPISPPPGLPSYLPAQGLPLPPLDESHWRFVFQLAMPEEEEFEEEGVEDE